SEASSRGRIAGLRGAASVIAATRPSTSVETPCPGRCSSSPGTWRGVTWSSGRAGEGPNEPPDAKGGDRGGGGRHRGGRVRRAGHRGRPARAPDAAGAAPADVVTQTR